MSMAWCTGDLDYFAGEWNWERGATAILHRRDLECAGLDVPSPGDRVTIGNYRARVQKRQPFDNWALVVVPDVWYLPVLLFWDRVKATAGLVKICLIRAACVWHLAFKPESEVYRWRNIFIMARLMRWLGIGSN